MHWGPPAWPPWVIIKFWDQCIGKHPSRWNWVSCGFWKCICIWICIWICIGIWIWIYIWICICTLYLYFGNYPPIWLILYFLAGETADSSETNSGVNFENMYLCKFVFELGNFEFGNFVFWESSLKLTHLGETETILYFLPEETAESGGSPSNSFLSNREMWNFTCGKLYLQTQKY